MFGELLIRHPALGRFRAVLGHRENYRVWLKAEFAERCQRNPGYSLRSFARDLKILPSRLGDILHGHQGMSVTVAKALASRLAWSESEREHFAALVEAALLLKPSKSFTGKFCARL